MEPLGNLAEKSGWTWKQRQRLMNSCQPWGKLKAQDWGPLLLAQLSSDTLTIFYVDFFLAYSYSDKEHSKQSSEFFLFFPQFQHSTSSPMVPVSPKSRPVPFFPDMINHPHFLISSWQFQLNWETKSTKMINTCKYIYHFILPTCKN